MLMNILRAYTALTAVPCRLTVSLRIVGLSFATSRTRPSFTVTEPGRCTAEDPTAKWIVNLGIIILSLSMRLTMRLTLSPFPSVELFSTAPYGALLTTQIKPKNCSTSSSILSISWPRVTCKLDKINSSATASAALSVDGCCCRSAMIKKFVFTTCYVSQSGYEKARQTHYAGGKNITNASSIFTYRPCLRDTAETMSTNEQSGLNCTVDNDKMNNRISKYNNPGSNFQGCPLQVHGAEAADPSMLLALEQTCQRKRPHKLKFMHYHHPIAVLTP